MKLRSQSSGGNPRPMEVWNANVYFDDRSGAKNRPVIVLEKRGEEYTVYMVTSHPHHPETDIRLMEPYEVMLDRTSHVRTDRPFRLPADKFNYKLGKLCYDDSEMVRAIFESRTKESRQYRRGNYRGGIDGSGGRCDGDRVRSRQQAMPRYALPLQGRALAEDRGRAR